MQGAPEASILKQIGFNFEGFGEPFGLLFGGFWELVWGYKMDFEKNKSYLQRLLVCKIS